jgi:hypothetical protein
MTIKRALQQEPIMADDKNQPDPNDQPQQRKSEHAGQDAQRQAGAAGGPAEPGQRAAPGRRPLFRS